MSDIVVPLLSFALYHLSCLLLRWVTRPLTQNDMVEIVALNTVLPSLLAILNPFVGVTLGLILVIVNVVKTGFMFFRSLVRTPQKSD